MFKNLLVAAKENLAAFERSEEIKDLDVTAEEYVMLRDDKAPIAIELLLAILEKLNLNNWDVDSNTLRIVRTSQVDTSRRNQWALAITSDTRRFHLKVYRDYIAELTDMDLGGKKGLSATILFIETTINEIDQRKIFEAEQQRLAALEELERKRIEAMEEAQRAYLKEQEDIKKYIETINFYCNSIYSNELSSALLSEELVDFSHNFVKDLCLSVDTVEVTFPTQNHESEKIDGFDRYKIMDGVPCLLSEDGSTISVSSSHILNCLKPKNLVEPRKMIFAYEYESKSLVVDFSPAAPDYFVRVINGLDFTENWEHRFTIRSINSPIKILTGIGNTLLSISNESRNDMTKVEVFGLPKISFTKESLKEYLSSTVKLMMENVKLIKWSAGIR